MNITKEFKDAIESGNKLYVYIMLKDSLILDPTTVQFEEMIKFAENKIGSVYVEHDGEYLNFNQNEWDEQYLNEELVCVVENFSKERVDLIKNMLVHLRQEEIKIIRSERERVRKSSIPKKDIGIAVTGVGAIATIAGLYTTHMPLTIGGLVVVATGVAVLASAKGE